MKTVLLIGGKSSRMGSPKHLLKLNNKTFFDLLSETLEQIAPLYISCSQNNQIPSCSYPVIIDQYASIGPMNGLYSSLSALNDSILVVPCDHPFITSNHLKQFITYDDEKIDALILVHQGKAYPTIGLYHPSCIDAMKRSIFENNYRMMHLLSKLNTKYVEASKIGLTEIELANINTPSDYQNIIKAV